MGDRRCRNSPEHWLASTRQKASSSRLSSFTDEVLRYASALGIKVVLFGGLELANLTIEHGVGVTTESVYKIKRIDSDYFDLP